MIKTKSGYCTKIYVGPTNWYEPDFSSDESRTTKEYSMMAWWIDELYKEIFGDYLNDDPQKVVEISD